MGKKKNVVKNAMIASAIIACSGFQVNAAEIFQYNSLGSSSEVRANLSGNPGQSHGLELNCGSAQKGAKDANCGEGKCGAKKKEAHMQKKKAGEDAAMQKKPGEDAAMKKKPGEDAAMKKMP